MLREERKRKRSGVDCGWGRVHETTTSVQSHAQHCSTVSSLLCSSFLCKSFFGTFLVIRNARKLIRPKIETPPQSIWTLKRPNILFKILLIIVVFKNYCSLIKVQFLWISHGLKSFLSQHHFVLFFLKEYFIRSWKASEFTGIKRPKCAANNLKRFLSEVQCLQEKVPKSFEVKVYCENLGNV